MNLELRQDIVDLKEKSVYAVIGGGFIAFISFIGQMTENTSYKGTIQSIAIAYLLVTLYLYLKIIKIYNKHISD